jgi:XapX domain-containing protein
MKAYLFSLGTGLLVGAVYSLLNVRSPAPPVVALVGLLGILIGEQVPPIVKHVWQRQSAGQAWFEQVKPHMFGALPKGGRSVMPEPTEGIPDGTGRDVGTQSQS